MTALNINEISLDVCINISQDTNPDWVIQCLDSVNVAINKAQFKVNLCIADAIPGNIGQARQNAINMGSGNFVTFVDDDDYLLPRAFFALTEYLRRDPVAIYTSEKLMDMNGNITDGTCGHHLAVYRRNELIDFTKWPDFELIAQAHAVKNKNIIKIQESTYVYRQYDSKAGRLHADNQHLLQKLI